MKNLVEKIIKVGSKIYISNNNLKIEPSIKQYPNLLEEVKKNKSNIITYLTKKWTDEKNLDEISSLPLLYYKKLPYPPLLEIEIPGIGIVFFDTTKKPKIGKEYGIVFDNRDIDEIIKYYWANKLTPDVMNKWCKQKQKNPEYSVLYAEKQKSEIKDIAFSRVLLAITGKLISVRLDG